MKNMTDASLQKNVERLIKYGLITELITKSDVIFVRNIYLDILQLENPMQCDYKSNVEVKDLPDILMKLCDGAYDKGLIKENSTVYRDLFDTRLMAVMVQRPSEIINTFEVLERTQSIEAATDWYYKLSQDTDYIRRYRVSTDIKWVADTPYGGIDITINLSKPEKDPKVIAAIGKANSTVYPRCLLCEDNEGYAGRTNHPSRMNHRTIPMVLNGEKWGMQYSPYVYYQEHCIIFCKEHVPMAITKKTFNRILEFVERFPHYILGSNADLPIVGGSILSHDHFQGGKYEFPMARAHMEYEFKMKRYPDISAEVIKWPVSVIRLRSSDREILAEACGYCLEKWRAYSDAEYGIYAFTGDEPHNTISPVARKRGNLYEVDLALRNNITTKEYPLGVFHPHEEYHHIKKENIGIIEAMGLAILPARLKSELQELKEAMLSGARLDEKESMAKHADWAKEVLNRHPEFNNMNAESILRNEVGIVFSHVLEDSGVFKCTVEGRIGFRRFTNQL